MTELEKTMLINENMTIEDAMRVIDQGISKTVFLVSDYVLKGSMTDGDVRRHLLKGGALNESVCKIINYSPKFFKENDSANYQDYMIENDLTAIPIVDNQMKIIRIERLKNNKESIRKIEESIPVVIMAGGFGSRLKPYTEIIPKPLIPIGSKTILERIFDKFEEYGCYKKYVIINYKKKLIEAYFKEDSSYSDLYFIEEPSFLGTAGGIKYTKGVCRDNFFVTNCDVVIDTDYYFIWEEHKKKGNIMTMVLANREYCVPYGTVEISDNGNVICLCEKPRVEYKVNTGMYLCNAKLLDYIDDSEKIDMPELIQRCLNAGEKIGQVTIDGNDWYDMGQLDELEKMKKRYGTI
ncbi:MAG: NTP transferase domain-containing protein [Lachnospiraceae bacterium]|nr:NTP transferase domain-containing protein [Lachnospiraceae bacterium]